MRRRGLLPLLLAVGFSQVLAIPATAQPTPTPLKVFEYPSADARLDTQQEAGGKHRQVDVLVGSHTSSQRYENVSVPVIPFALESSIFPDTNCTELLVTADASNDDAIWVYPKAAIPPTPTPSPGPGNAIPIYPGDSQALRAPNDRNCGHVYLVGGPGCLPTPCRAHVLVQ